MTLLALDPASRTGWCAYQDLGQGRAPRIACGSIQAAGADEGAFFASYSVQLRNLIEEHRPRLIGIEREMTTQASEIVEPDPTDMLGGKRRRSIRNHQSVLVQIGIRGIILALIGQRRPSWGLPNGIPFVFVHMSTWRKSFIGCVKAPAHVPRAKSSQWLKAEARMKAELWGQKYGFNVPNTDAGDAVGIAFHLAGTREGIMAARAEKVAA